MAVNNGWLNRCRGAVVAVLATLPLLLASCGDTPLGPSGTVVVVSPYTPAPAGGAIVSQTPPADLASLVIEVRDSANAVLAGPITVIPGQPAQLEVESGEGRILLLQGLDSAGDAIYSGTSAPFSLQPDETKPVALDVYGAMLKGSTTLTSGASLSVYGDGQTTPVASSSVAADGSFKIILPPKPCVPTCWWPVRGAMWWAPRSAMRRAVLRFPRFLRFWPPPWRTPWRVKALLPNRP